MKKINLKSILKKTFKKKKKKKVKTKPKIKTKKNIIKKVGRPKTSKKEILNKTEKKDLKKNINKNDNLKLTKTLDQKPEIVKIKKQGTEKREYKIKDYVVYPKHGVGQILSVSAKKIGGIDVHCYDIKFEKDKAIGLLPINKQIRSAVINFVSNGPVLAVCVFAGINSTPPILLQQNCTLA